MLQSSVRGGVSDAVEFGGHSRNGRNSEWRGKAHFGRHSISFHRLVTCRVEGTLALGWSADLVVIAWMCYYCTLYTQLHGMASVSWPGLRSFHASIYFKTLGLR